MKKSIIGIIAILLIVGSIGSVFCFDPRTVTAPWLDPAKTTYWVDNQQVTAEDFYNSIEADVIAHRSDAGNIGSTAATPQPAASNQTASTPKAAKEKLIVYFTDENGRVIGTSQVTKGTTVAESQFMQEVPECNGKAFDHWDYDGRTIEHQFIIRAVYK